MEEQGWGYESSGRVPALQMQCPEFKHQYLKGEKGQTWKEEQVIHP